MANEIKPGDIVCLRSSTNIQMTVGYIENGIAYCHWYDKTSSSIKTERIYIAALIKAAQ